MYWKKNKGNLTNKDKRLWKKQNEISELKVTKDKEYNDYKNEKGEKQKIFKYSGIVYMNMK